MSSRYEVTIGDDGSVAVSGAAERLSRYGHIRIGDHTFDRFFGSDVAPELADLVEVGMAVYAADRACRRPNTPDSYRHDWHRQITVRIPVRDPRRWRALEVSEHLHQVLCWMTEDTWKLEFTQRGGRPRVSQGSLFRDAPSDPRIVALSSGGLDSFAGLCTEALEQPNASFVLVSGWTNSRLLRRQETVARGFAARVRRDILPVMVPFGLRRGDSDYNDDERTQRTRGFVHTLLGAAVALALNETSVACYENGVGALNLPLSPVQLGAQNSRSAHPIALADVADLVEMVTRRPFEVRLPFLMRTKGQMCRAIATLGVESLVRETVSCDSFPRREAGTPECGACTSCILRRQALKVAGLESCDPCDQYAVDLHQPIEIGSDLNRNMDLMLQQVSQLRRALARPVPWFELAREFPMLHQTAMALHAHGEDVAGFRKGVVTLFEEYCGEWERFQQTSIPFVA